MGDYYNSTRGPLPATLVDGSAVSFSPKSWLYITPENEGSASIVKLLEKGFLVRAKVAITVLPAPSAPAPEASSSDAVAASVAADAKPADDASKSIEMKADASTSSMKEENFRKKK